MRINIKRGLQDFQGCQPSKGWQPFVLTQIKHTAFPLQRIYIIFKKNIMEAITNGFNTLVETIYNLPLDEKQELKNLLEHNIADSRRDEMAVNYKKSQAEQKTGKLKFSSSANDLKKMV